MINKVSQRQILLKNAASGEVFADAIRKEALAGWAKKLITGGAIAGGIGAGTALGYRFGQKKGTTTGQQQVLQRLLPEYIRTRLVVNQLLQERAALNKKIK